MTDEQMLTGAKIAQKLGVKPKQVAEAIEKQGIEPDQKKGACKYYGPKTVEKIKKALS